MSRAACKHFSSGLPQPLERHVSSNNAFYRQFVSRHQRHSLQHLCIYAVTVPCIIRITAPVPHRTVGYIRSPPASYTFAHREHSQTAARWPGLRPSPLPMPPFRCHWQRIALDGLPLSAGELWFHKSFRRGGRLPAECSAADECSWLISSKKGLNVRILY